MALHGDVYPFPLLRAGSTRLAEGHLLIEHQPSDSLAADVLDYFETHPALAVLILATTSQHFAIVFRGPQDIERLLSQLRFGEPDRWNVGPSSLWFTQLTNGNRHDPSTVSHWSAFQVVLLVQDNVTYILREQDEGRLGDLNLNTSE